MCLFYKRLDRGMFRIVIADPTADADATPISWEESSRLSHGRSRSRVAITWSRNWTARNDRFRTTKRQDREPDDEGDRGD
jgi:hypothetical protein